MALRLSAELLLPVGDCVGLDLVEDIGVERLLPPAPEAPVAPLPVAILAKTRKEEKLLFLRRPLGKRARH